MNEFQLFPLTNAQQRIWYTELLYPNTTVSLFSGISKMRGRLDFEVFKRSINRLIEHHDSFRIRITSENGQPRQYVVPYSETEFECLDIADFESADQAEQWLKHHRQKPLELFDSPLYDFVFIKMSEEEYWFNMKFHHIVFDGISIDIFVEKITEYYLGLMNGTEPGKEDAHSFIDYIQTEQAYERSERYEKDKAYWLEKFAHLPEATGLKIYNPLALSTEAANKEFTVDPVLYEELKAFCGTNNISLFHFFMAAMAVYMHKVTNAPDVTIGTAYANRTTKKEKSTIGMFVSTVVTRSYVDPDIDLLSFVHQVSKEQLSILRHQKYPYNKLIQDLRGVHPNVDVLRLFGIFMEYRQMNWGDMDGIKTEVEFDFGGEEVNDLVVRVVEMLDDHELVLHMEYRTHLFEDSEVERIVRHLLAIAQCIVRTPEQKIGDVSLISEAEKHTILTRFNDTSADYPQKTIYRLFEEQAERAPDKPAAVFEGNRLTYGELNERANRVARVLRGWGVGADSPVAILVERSLEMVVGMLAVLKAGGAYVPIDPQYPEDRIRFMLEDSGAGVLLTQSRWMGRTFFPEQVLCLDDAGLYEGPAEDGANLEPVSAPEHLAYMIYTSGTTGKPKGVMVEQRSVVNFVLSLYEPLYATYPEYQHMAQLAPYVFDMSVKPIYGALLMGRTLHIVPEETRMDGGKLLAFFREHDIDITDATPTYLSILVQCAPFGGSLRVKHFIVGGEALSSKVVRSLWSEFGEQVKITNVYGPTECTVDSTIYEVVPERLTEAMDAVPIGQPLPNQKLWILDAKQRLLPIGVAGELCIGGAGVARGYNRRPELTAEKFIASPFAEGERMYRTGDLARWLPDGNIEYLGRIDHQVKIRGYRIELGEVEAKLLKTAAVQEAVVLAQEDGHGQKYLCAYFVADTVLTASELRGRLAQELPGYMLPSYFVQLTRMPLTPNGKIDRKALPAPSGDLQTGAEYAAPQTKTEQTLASVWEGVLGAGKIGIRDNFFDLGGDSIKAIQVSSRMLQAGYKLEMRDLFKYPTIAELSLHVQTVNRVAPQEAVTGATELTPIQRAFFAQPSADLHHYNQAVMLYREGGFEIKALRQVMKKIAEHHDALRLVFRQSERGYEAWNRDIGEGELYSLEVMDCRGSENIAAAIEAKANEIQSGINLTEGPLMKLGLFQAEAGDHLLIVIHHLAVDGVSWRILFEDIATGYEQARNGQAIRFPYKTDSFRSWAKQLSLYAGSPALERERAYWRQIEQTDTLRLPKDYDQDNARVEDSETVTAQWTAQETEQLLKQAHQAYNTEMNDLLLTALGMAVRKWTGSERVLVNLEGHGREPIIPDIDVTRTVGWFTSIYPVVLDMGTDREVSSLIKRVKEGLRQIPHKGIGYGILKYLSASQEESGYAITPEIGFNYLGQFDQDLNHNELRPSPFSPGASVSGKRLRKHVLDMNGMVTDGALALTISYSVKQYRRETMERLCGLIRESLCEVIAHCVAKERPELTPSDVLLKGITLEQLDQLAAQTRHVGEIENVYRLTPMQKGMLFHSLLEPSSTAYFEQAMFELQEDFDPDSFAQSFDALVQRHAVLRTNFYSAWDDQPVQVVYRSRKTEYYYEDVRGIEEAHREAYIEAYAAKDKARGFDLAQDILFRMSILRTGETSYRHLWSFHHIIMDGWCMPLIAREIFEHYAALRQQRQPKLAPALPYSQYIEWLERQDEEASSKYWKELLNGYDQHPVLPQAKLSNHVEGYAREQSNCDLNEKLSKRLEDVAKRQQVTVNTLMQAAWGIVVQKYNNMQDVVFGSVVSGRPAEIPGIESMIGLFINTIPVRVRTERDSTFAEVLQRIQEQALASHAHDTYPLFEIQANTEQKQNLVTHIMVFENYPMERQMEQAGSGDQADFEILSVSMFEQTNYDFNIAVIPGKTIRISFQYNALVYEQEAVERMQGHLLHVIEQIAADPQIRVSELELVTPQEKTLLLEAWGGAKAEYPQGKTIHRLFEEQAARTPERVAVVYEGDRLTYRELNERADRLACTLQAEGVQAEQLVGLMVERSLEMIVGIFGILKAGGAYLPIDPGYPEGRIRYMLDDSGAQLLLTQRRLRERVAFAGRQLLLDEEETYAREEAAADLTAVVGPDNLAYVIYTSGTTGQPKGVLVEHRGLCNLKPFFERTLQVKEDDKVVQFASFSFDASCWETLMALFTGAALYIPASSTILDYSLFERFMNENGITTATLPPAYAIYLEPDRLPALTRLITAGSSSSAELVQKWKDRVMYFNAYGPTEDSICSSIWSYSSGSPVPGSVPIGRPVTNHRLYILDANDRLVPAGVAGQLCTAGVGLARGYLNRDDLTAEKFASSPFDAGERMYRTGDLARWLPDGNLEYLGRIDHQVKIRGYRIELGEIEASLMSVEGVQEAIVTAREEENGQKQLCAYYVAKEQLSGSGLREALSRKLPGYMIPAYFVQLEHMPLTPNGKIDRKALPAPEESLQAEHVAPRTAVEAQLAHIWQEILGHTNVGVKDSFFDIGGHSLRATVLVSRIRKEMNGDLTLREIFQASTIERMAQLLESRERTAYASIPAAAESEYYPVSSAQKRLYVLSQLEGGELSYNMPGVLTVEGPLDRERAEEAFRQLIRRHEALRTSFETVDGEPMQRVHPEAAFAVEYAQAKEEEAEARIRAFIRPFDLGQAPLLRVGLIELAPERHLLLFDMHHIVSDGVSMGILVEEFNRLYEGKEVPALRIQYKDYAVWQQEELSGERLSRQEAYWLDVFRGGAPVLDLPTDYARPALRSFEGDRIAFAIGKEQSEGLKRLAAQTGSTLYMVLLAAYTTLLYKYTGQEDIVVGTPIAGRQHADLGSVIGMFVNTLAIRNYPAGQKSFRDYLEEVRETLLKAYENQDYPFESLVERLEARRDLSRNPLFDTMFVLQNTEREQQTIDGLKFHEHPFEHPVTKFDLTFSMTEEAGALACRIEYARALFNKRTIERMADHFGQLIDAIVNNSQARLSELEMITTQEKALLLEAWGGAKADYPREKTIHRLFEEQAERTPEQVAVMLGEDGLTYRELNERANRLARTLRDEGVQAEQMVGLMVERSLEMIVGMLGILKAGGAYVPIDPDYPEERIRYMLDNSQAKLLLTQKHLQAKAEFAGRVLDLADERNYHVEKNNLDQTGRSDSLACVMYTSGSTGRPKGNLTMHYNIVRVVKETNYIRFTENDRILQLSSFSFDGSTFDIYGALLNGATLMLINRDQMLDARELSLVLKEKRITKCFVTTALFNTLVDIDVDCFETVETLLFGGEKASIGHVQKAFERLGPGRLVNVYGPTESTVYATYYPIDRLYPDISTIPIGKPISNTSVFVLDQERRLQPIGVPGELYIGGDGLARGYWNLPGLTGEKFVSSPLVQDGKLYRTGDLVRWLEDGNIEYLSRIDEQVKIRGYRIELGEIEASLMSVEGVQEAIVTAREEENGQKQLCAYYVAKEQLSGSGLREALSRKLPGYMIPAYFVQLEHMPLTPNGKIDRKALPAPEESLQAEHVAPRTAVEAQLAHIWQEILGHTNVGVKDSFFDIGGHSLRATVLVSRIRKEMNGDLTLREIFQASTIERMAQLLESRERTAYSSIPAAAESEYYPVSSAQKRLYVLSQLEGGELSYNMPGVLTVEGPLDRERAEEAFRQLIRRHEALRTSFETVDGEPVQRVHPEAAFAVEYAQAKEEEAEARIRAFIRPFDLGQAPLLRVGLIELAPERHLLLFDMHHIVSDGVSMGILIEEFNRLYEGKEVPALRIQYKDYAVWQQEELSGERLSRQEAYWLDVFRGGAPVLDLPTDYARPALRSFEGDRIAFAIGKEQSEGLKRLAAQTGSTLYMVLLAAYTTLLYKYTGQEDIVVGMPIAGRQHADLGSVIGMFVNTLAIRNYPAGQKGFRDYLEEVRETLLKAYENQDYPFESLVERLEVRRDLSRNPLFDTMFVLQNTEQREQNFEGLHFKPAPFRHEVAKFDLTFNVTEEEDALVCSIEYASALYDRATVQRMGSHFAQILDIIVKEPQTVLQSMEIITPQEKTQILEIWGNTEADYPQAKTIHQLFEEQAERTPEQTAIIYEGERLTYRELNERANRLARTLIAEGGRSERLIGLMVERSIEMVVGIFGILKAGGAYVPIDPEYPEERIRYMLEDSGVDLLLTQNRLKERIGFDGRLLALDDASVYHQDGSNVNTAAKPDNLAYVIYTSGTTGKPKGVMVGHRGLCNLKTYFDHALNIGINDKVVQFASYSFDAACWEFVEALFCGATLCVPSSGTILNYRLFEDYIAEHGITVATLPPTYAVYLDPDRMPSLRILFTAGSASSVELLQKWKGRVNYYNGFGPTENSVATTIWSASEEPLADHRVSIGRPIPNHRVYIVDPAGHLLPVGVPGELCVTGVGLARGYLNRSELTAEKFVPNPFAEGERMYRTGDLARWLPDGKIEYLGRIDHQVKIRGYRIELGEVETQILKAASVQEAIVIDREDESGQKQLCAYFVADRELSPSVLRNSLLQRLPNYMVPSYFVQLEHMPLTPNGKIDRQALPAPAESSQPDKVYTPPRTAAEQALASVWQAVLGSERVGITDNFFDLGGDSIKAIQVASRMLQAGYKLEMKTLFSYPTIAELSGHLSLVGQLADQGEVTGEVKLTPIVHWFFEQQFDKPHHFNQAVMLYCEQGFDETALRQVMKTIAEHHDALRMVFEQTEDGRYSMVNRGVNEGEPYSMDIFDYRGEPACAETIEAKATELQSGIVASRGPLMKTGLFRCDDGDHLLIVIHHLAVDGVSWRILLEDLASGYEQALKGEAIRLPHKTTSFQVWAERLSRYAKGPEIESERAYWLQISQAGHRPLPKDDEKAAQQPLRMGENESIKVRLTAQETERLLKQAHRAYNTEVNDLLLTALGMAVHAWTGMEQVLVNLEGHGREDILPETDITRTVGWFTSQYPVVLKTGSGRTVSQRIKEVKEGLRGIPNKGIGYGILRYLSESQGENPFEIEPEISFNYLGQFDHDLEQGAIRISPYSSGVSVNESNAFKHPLSVSGTIMDGVLVLDVRYHAKVYRKETMERLAALLKESLQEVLAHCVGKERPELTPSDVLFKGLTVEQLDWIVEHTQDTGEIENIYEMTPMQKGMMFHHLMEPDSRAYFQQAVFELSGSLDTGVFAESLELLTQRHETLRTNFYSGWQKDPLQIVFRTKRSEVWTEDLRSMEKAERERYIAAFVDKDKARGFDLAKDALMRVAILRTGDEAYRFVWSFHHIVMDGWCLPLITNEVFGAYFAMLNQRPPVFAEVSPFRRYMEWLERQDRQKAAAYWRDYLAGYEQRTLLPKTSAANQAEGYVLEQLIGDLGTELTRKIHQAAKKHQVTVNTLMQVAWGIVLQRYNGSRDVVFGSVVSGRPEEIPGIERMIGLFINTVPVRVQTDGDQTFADVLKRSQEQALASHAYDTYPLYEIQAHSEQKMNLISHLMIFENYPVEQQMEQAGSNDREPFEISSVHMFEQTNYDFNLIVMPGETIKVCFRYNALAHDRASVERIRGHLIHMLEQAAGNPEMLVNELEIVTPQEKAQMLEVWGEARADYPKDKAVHQLFEEQAERTPERIAVAYEDSRLTYRELNEQANRLARTLIAEGVQGEQLVALMVDRSLEMIVGILGILKAGAAYVPIDPEYPEERVRYILEDSGAGLLLTQRHLREQSAFFQGKLIDLNDAAAYSEDGTNLKTVIRPLELAYLIYTSGTTGRPKGAMITHQGLVNYIWWAKDTYIAGEQLDFPLYSSISFDLTVTSVFAPLITGNTIRIYEAADKTALIRHIVEKNQVDIIKLTPTHLSLIKEMDTAGDSRIRKLIVGGENLSTSLSKSITERFNGKIEIFNEYGPTETVVGCMIYRYDPVKDTRESVPIGRPAANVSIYLLDQQLKLVPLGVPGEMYIGGDGVARGYWNRPDLTEEKFIADPFKPGARMYRTGDLARWLPDGNIEYLGRIDHQVKIRGYRIELGEVEAQLLNIASVREAIVTAREDGQGHKYLCAYFVADRPFAAGELRGALSAHLPGYMIPSYFVQLERIPLTPNGKVDRNALPAPEGSAPGRAEFAAPRTSMEARLAQIWKEVLEVENVGIKDNFFDLGGHSLKILQLARSIDSSLDIKLPLHTVFQAPTIEEMALALLKSKFEHDYGQGDSGTIRLNENGPVRVFSFPPLVGNSLGYYEMAKQLENHCIVYGMEFAGDRYEGEDLLNYYVDAMTGIQEKGPYVLLGYSLGGNLAFEVAKALESRGYEVSDIVMIDSFRKTDRFESSHEKMVEGVNQALEKYSDPKHYIFTEAIREQVKNKMYAYLKYSNELVNTGAVRANVHALIAGSSVAELAAADRERMSWKTATLKSYAEYEAAGDHEELLDAGYLEQNVSVLKQIVDQITERTAAFLSHS